MAPHSSTLAWKIPWTEEPGGLQSMGPLRVGHDWATSLSLFTFMKWQPTPVFLPGESQGRGAWWAAVYGVAQSRTRLKRLSSSSSNTLKVLTVDFLVVVALSISYSVCVNVCVCVCVICYLACWISQDLFARNPTWTNLKPTKENVLAHLLALLPLLASVFLSFNY